MAMEAKRQEDIKAKALKASAVLMGILLEDMKAAADNPDTGAACRVIAELGRMLKDCERAAAARSRAAMVAEAYRELEEERAIQIDRA